MQPLNGYLSVKPIFSYNYEENIAFSDGADEFGVGFKGLDVCHNHIITFAQQLLVILKIKHWWDYNVGDAV